MSLVPQADGTYLDDETGLIYDSSGGILTSNSPAIAQAGGFWNWMAGGDSITEAAVRARGIDPATGQFIGDYGKTPANQAELAAGKTSQQIAVEVAQAASDQYQRDYATNKAQLDAAHAKAGGFLADLLNPFSPNVDPNAWNAKLANSLKGINWTAVIALGIVLAVAYTIHEVREI